MKRLPKKRPHPERVEESGRNARPGDPFSIALPCEVEREVADACIRCEARHLSLQITQAPGPDRFRLSLVGVADEYQPVGIRKWEGSEEYRVDHAEDRRVGADAERKRQHGNRGKSWRATQPAARVDDILTKVRPHAG